MKLFVLFFFLCTHAMAAYFPPPSVAKYDSNAVIEGAFDVANSAVYKSSPAASTDPFSSKTNKYAESQAIMVTCTGAGAHIKFGAAAPTATTDNFVIPQNLPMVFKIDPSKPYVALIQAAATATCWTVELK
jgi:hypothetical protein